MCIIFSRGVLSIYFPGSPQHRGIVQNKKLTKFSNNFSVASIIKSRISRKKIIIIFVGVINSFAQKIPKIVCMAKNGKTQHFKN